MKVVKRLWRILQKLWRKLQKLWRIIEKLINKKKISIGESLTLILTGVIVICVSAFFINYKIKSDKAAKYDEMKNPPNTVTEVVNNVKSTVTLEEEEKKKAQEDLEAIVEQTKNLGPIELIDTPIAPTYKVEIGEENVTNRWAVIEKKGFANCKSYQETSEIEFVLDDKNEIIGYIDRPTILKENVNRDTSKGVVVLRHPVAGMKEGIKDKNELIRLWKTEVDNDDKKGYISKEDISKLDAEWDLNFNDYAYEMVEKELLSNKKYMKKLEESAINRLTNVYNPDVYIEIPSKENNGNEEATKIKVPNKTKVKFKFKDQR